MTTFRGASLVAVRCSSALCFLLLPPYLVNQQRGHQLLSHGKEQHGFLLSSAGTTQPQQHKLPPVQILPKTLLHRPPPTTSVTFTPPSNLRPAALHLRAANKSDPLEESNDEENDCDSASSSSTTTTTESSSTGDNSHTKDNSNPPQEGRIRRIQRTATGKLRSFLETGRSLLKGVRARERTAMEAAQQQQQKQQHASHSVTMRPNLKHDPMRSVDDNNNNNDDDETDHHLPQGPRWAIAHPNTDLSGTWKPIITPEFQHNYDRYLECCGTNYYFRKVCLSFCGTTRERIRQQNQGRVLQLTGTSPAGQWDRSLLSSGADGHNDDGTYEEVYATFLDPDRELVTVEAWWEDQGKVHTSFLRNKAGVCGGAFESRRYLDTAPDGITPELVCESTFHPSQNDLESPQTSKFKPAFVQWRYRRQE